MNNTEISRAFRGVVQQTEGGPNVLILLQTSHVFDYSPDFTVLITKSSSDIFLCVLYMCGSAFASRVRKVIDIQYATGESCWGSPVFSHWLIETLSRDIVHCPSTRGLAREGPQSPCIKAGHVTVAALQDSQHSTTADDLLFCCFELSETVSHTQPDSRKQILVYSRGKSNNL